MQARYDYGDPTPRQAAYPQMSWGSNHRLPANGIMWTLFWSGRLFTPHFQVEGRNVQDFLQGRYLGAMDQVAARLAHMPHVLGFDSLNEPGIGWMTAPLSYRHLAPSPEHPERPRVGPALAPIDSLAIAQGATVTAPLLIRAPDGRAAPTGTATLNPRGVRIWRDGADCPFERAGAYRMAGGAAPSAKLERGLLPPVRRAAHFPSPTTPARRCLRRRGQDHPPPPAGVVGVRRDGRLRPRRGTPFPRRPARALGQRRPLVRCRHPLSEALRSRPTTSTPAAARRERDAGTIGARYVAPAGRPRRRGQARLSRAALRRLIGEFGIPLRPRGRGGLRRQAAGQATTACGQLTSLALALTYDAMDELGLHATQWNYTASNRNDPLIGDRWNQEDLSIFSRDQQDDPSDPDSGGRAVAGPYHCRILGAPHQEALDEARFDRATGGLRLDLQPPTPAIAEATEVFVPRRPLPARLRGPLRGRSGRDRARRPCASRVRALAPSPGLADHRTTVEPQQI